MEKTTTIAAKDGLELFIRSWIPPQYKAVIALVHGFGEHTGRYQHVADFLNANGYAVVGIDHRGHGKSGGKRGHSPSFDMTLDDMELFIAQAKKMTNDTLPFFLYGHSMGGNFVLNTLLRRNPTGITGAAVTGPLIGLSFKPNAVLVFFGRFLRFIAPTFSQPGGVKTEHLSRDKAVVTAYINDPLVHGTITSAAGMDLLEASEFLDKYSGALPVPTLVMHGGADFVTSQPRSEAFAQRITNTSDLTYRKWDGFYHEIHNEPEKAAVLGELLAWLDARV